MKLIVLICAIIGSLAAVEVDNIVIQEGGEFVKERIVLDKQRGISIYHTGDHCGREAVTELVDSNFGVVVKKFNMKKDKSCIIRPYDPKIDSNPNEASRSLKETHNVMPKKIVEYTEDFIRVEYKGTVPKHIKHFCGPNREILSQEIVTDLKAAAVIALKHAKEAKTNERKRAVLREFTACTNASTMKIMTCPGDKLEAKCKIRSSSCTYHVRCPMSLQKGGFDCKGLHKFNSMICCDYNC